MQSYRGTRLREIHRSVCCKPQHRRSVHYTCRASSSGEPKHRVTTPYVKAAQYTRSLVPLQVKEAKVVENESNINKKVLASAAVVCIATQVLTVQGLLLTAYAAALTAAPVGAVRHALKKRNAWPALFLLSSAILIPNIAVLRGAYMSVVNPVSVHLKARITLPAVVHAFVGSKHPILKGTLQAAQVISQLVLVGMLLQYLLAPKIAESMRQKAIMLCRALTTTESQGLKKERAKASGDLEDWVVSSPIDDASGESGGSFIDSITRGSPRRREGSQLDSPTNPGTGKRRQPLNLTEGQQPSIDDIYSHAGLEYAFLNARQGTTPSSLKHNAANIQTADFQDLFQNSTKEDIQQAKQDLAQLGLSFESEADTETADSGLHDSSSLESVVGSISSTAELFQVLNENLRMVEDLSDEVRNKGLALRQSEYAREDLVRELKATVGEKNVMSKELSHLSLKFEAAQSMWEKHLKQGGSVNDLITEEVLEKVVDALNERKKGLFLDYIDATPEEELEQEDQDALAARFRVVSEKAQGLKEVATEQNNAQPFERNTARKVQNASEEPVSQEMKS